MVATGDKLLAGAIIQWALRTIGALLQEVANGSVMLWYISPRQPCGIQWESSSQNWLLESGRQSRVTRTHKTLAQRGLNKLPCRFWYLCWNLTVLRENW
jgi:hypothetical protein